MSDGLGSNLSGVAFRLAQPIGGLLVADALSDSVTSDEDNDDGLASTLNQKSVVFSCSFAFFLNK